MAKTQKQKPTSSTPGWRGYAFPMICAVVWLGAVLQFSFSGGLFTQPALRLSSGLKTVTAAGRVHASVEDITRPLSTPSRYNWLIPRSWYDPMIQKVASAHGVDPALVKAMVQAESAFDPLAVSEDGARGLMQVLPETAARYRVRDRDLHNPYLNLQAGVSHLRSLLDLFDGNLRLAIAAYNAGENAVRRHRGVPPYPETRDYLDKVLGLYWQYRRVVSANDSEVRKNKPQKLIVSN